MKHMTVFITSMVVQIWFWFYLGSWLIVSIHPLSWWFIPFFLTAWVSTVFGSMGIANLIDKYWK